MRNLIVIFIVLGMLAFTSCNWFTGMGSDERIARVKNSYLYRSDLEGLVKPGTSAADSTAIIRRYVDNWVRQQIYLQESQNNIDVASKEFQRKIEDYRTSLIIFNYESLLIQNQMDTVISNELMAEYYEKHQEEFQLRDHIVQVNFIKLPLDAPEQNRVRRMIQSSDPEDIENLEEYCLNHAATYFLDQESWFIFTDILRDMPVSPQSHEAFLRNNTFVERNDDFYRYFLYIRDYRLEGSTSPLAFQSENIRSIILNHRKQNLINEYRQEVFKEAVRNSVFEVY